MKTKTNRNKLLICVTLFWAAQYVFMPYQTPYMAAMSIASDTIGMIVGAYGFTQMLMRFPIGVNADRKAKHKPFIATGFACIVICSVLRIFADNAILFLIANLVSGIGSAMWISFTILFSNMFNEDELQGSISLIFSLNQLGILFAYLLGLVIYPALTANSLFISSIVLALLGMFISFTIKEDSPTSSVQKTTVIIKNAVSKRLFFFSVLSLIIQAVVQSTQSSFTSQVAKNLGADSTGLGILSIISMATAFLASSMLNFKRIKQMKLSTIFIICGVFFTSYCLAVGFAKSVIVVYIAQFFGSFANAQFSSLFMSSAIKGCPVESKSTAMGIYQALYSIGMTVGPVIMGSIAESFSFTHGFCLMALLVVLDIVIYFSFRKKADATD